VTPRDRLLLRAGVGKLHERSPPVHDSLVEMNFPVTLCRLDQLRACSPHLITVYKSLSVAIFIMLSRHEGLHAALFGVLDVRLIS